MFWFFGFRFCWLCWKMRATGFGGCGFCFLNVSQLGEFRFESLIETFVSFDMLALINGVGSCPEEIMLCQEAIFR